MKLEQSLIPRKENLLATDEKKLEKVIALSWCIKEDIINNKRR
jgi:hypothetical protein